MAAFNMVDERLAHLEDIADHRNTCLEAVSDHWLRREHEREVDKGGNIDNTLMSLNRRVILV